MRVFDVGLFENWEKNTNLCEDSYKQEPWHYAGVFFCCAACLDKLRNQGYKLTVHSLDVALEKKQHKRPVKCELSSFILCIVSVLQLGRKHKGRCLRPPGRIHLAFCVKITSMSYFL